MTRTQLYLEPRSAQCVLTRRSVLWHAPGSVFCVQFVELDVQDLGGHLDFTTRAGAGTLTKSVKDARHGVAAVGALHLGFRFSWVWFVGSICQLGCMLLRLRTCLPPPSVPRAACVRSVWSSKMLLTNTPVVLNPLDGPVGVDPAFQIVWTRSRLTRRYLAHRLLPATRPWACASASYFCCGNWVCLGWRATRLDSCYSSSP